VEGGESSMGVWEEGAASNVETARHCCDGVAALVENLWVMMTWLQNDGEGGSLGRSRRRQMNISQLSQLGVQHGQHISVAGILFTDLIARPNKTTLCPPGDGQLSAAQRVLRAKARRQSPWQFLASERLRKQEQIVTSSVEPLGTSHWMKFLLSNVGYLLIT